MELIIRGSFLRDFENSGNKTLAKAIVEKKMEIIAAKDLSQISYLKKLRTRKGWYKIEIQLSETRIYWILCIIHKNKIDFVRIKPENYFKKIL